jgi:hypothetical protein
MAAAAGGAEDRAEKARLRNKLTEDVREPMAFPQESEKARCARDKRHTKRKNG